MLRVLQGILAQGRLNTLFPQHTQLLITMDAAHEASLARILENRRRRGVAPVPYQRFEMPSDQPTYTNGHRADSLNRSSDRDAPKDRHHMGLVSPNVRADSLGQAAPSKPSYDVENTRRQPEGKFLFSPAPTTASVAAEQHDVSTILIEQRQLRMVQMAHEKQLEDLKANINKNFGDLMAAMSMSNKAQSSSRDHVPAHGSIPFYEARSIDAQRHVSAAAVPNGPSPALTSQGYQRPPNAGTLPPPLAFSQGALTLRPTRSPHLDLKSAMTILKKGEWFIKWDGLKVQSAARYVWYDYTRSCLYWGPEKFTRTPLSGYIPLEDVVSVTTDQMTEFDGDVDRLFFILIIHTPKRNLYLATEKRAKLDCWFEALTIISLFNRVSSNGARNPVSSD